jgi:hypothetical protein
MERGGRKYGERLGGGQKVTGALLEGGEGSHEETRLSTAEKGKNVYVGQWDTIKEKMVWELADLNPHGWTCKANKETTCSPFQVSTREIPCRTTTLERKDPCETDGKVAERNSIFKFTANKHEVSRGARAVGKKEKKNSSRETGGKEENVRNNLGKRKTDSHDEETCTLGGKRNKKYEGELKLNDELSAGAGNQPRRQI